MLGLKFTVFNAPKDICCVCLEQEMKDSGEYAILKIMFTKQSTAAGDMLCNKCGRTYAGEEQNEAAGRMHNFIHAGEPDDSCYPRQFTEKEINEEKINAAHV